MKEWCDREVRKLFIAKRLYITEKDFAQLIFRVWQLYKPEIGINGFRKAGIFPFSRKAITVSSLNPSNAFPSTENNTNDDNDDDCNDTSDTNTHDNGNDELHDEDNQTIDNTNNNFDVHSLIHQQYLLLTY